MTPELDSLPPPVCPPPAAGNLKSASQRPASSIQDPASVAPQPLDFKPRRRRGPQSKIAQLPAEQRNLVNQLLDEDKTYEEVVEEMAKHGVILNTDNVFKWFNGPYQDYLAALDWQDELQRLRDQACPFGQEQGNVRFQEGVVQIGLTQIFRAIKEDRFKDDPANSLRLFNSLARLSREALVIRKYADQQAKEKVQELRKLDPNRKINDVEVNAMHDRADDFFGWKSAARIKRDLANEVRTDSTPSQIFPSDTALAAPNIDEGGTSIPDNSKDAFGRVPDSIPQSKFENQKSKISESPQPEGLKEGSRGSQSAETPGDVPAVFPHPDSSRRSSERRPEGMPESGHGSAPVHALPVSNIQNPPPAPQPSTTDTQPCYECGGILPPLLPNGQRPSHVCPGCGVRLYPPGTAFDHCSYCDAAQPLLLNNERPSPTCRRCGALLPPPGQRFVTHCLACHVELPVVTAMGTRISDRCHECRATLPLLEPIPPRPEPEAPVAEPSDLAA